MVAAYRVEFSPEALSDLEKLDRVITQRILRKIKWLSQNFDDLTPEALKGELKSLFKLRIVDWQVIYSVNQTERLITLHLIGHRKDIYK